jgi:hypothetical protein
MFTVYIGAPPDQALESWVLERVTEVGVTVDDDAEMSPRQSINTVLGTSIAGIGVAGSSQDDIGVYGFSESSSAVHGHATDGVGVSGYTSSTIGHHAGVKGDNGGSGDGVFGWSARGVGVSGHGPHSVGVHGDSETGIGVEGRSESYIGVSGYTSSTQPGILGKNDGEGAGVYGWSASGMGVRGVSEEAYGVSGYSSASVAVRGRSDTGRGVLGSSQTDIGVNGYTSSTELSKAGVVGENRGAGAGVYGSSNTGPGIYGTSTINFAVSGYTSSTIRATAGFQNAGSGLVLYLENSGAAGTASDGSGGGDFIRAVNEDGQDVQFRVTTSGTVESDGGYNTPAADFAEMLPAVEGVEPGDVLVIGIDGKLHRSTEPYQLSVVGVHSTQPGFVGGKDMDNTDAGQVPLAIMGVVPVKVSAENGAIRPGDLLVASAIPGHAMHAGANPANGTVIGKALGALTEGTGVIQMLVMLQ